MLCIRWLFQLLQHGCVPLGGSERPRKSLMTQPLAPWHVPFLERMQRACRCSLEFFHLLHSNGVWLSPEVARQMAQCAQTFCGDYSALAKLCHSRGLRRYHLEPTLHYFHHYGIDMIRHLRQHGEVPQLSPGVDNCEADEDFVGRQARLSRQCHATTTTTRTIERYLIKTYFVHSNQDWGSAAHSGLKR